MDLPALTRSLKAEAHTQGFDLIGICPAAAPTGEGRLSQWLAAGFAGEMHYFSTRREAYAHPDKVLAGVRTLVMLGLNYRTAEPRPPAAGEGRVSRYAWGTADYHDLIHDRLKRLADFLQSLAPKAAVRGVVDTAPLLEREFAQLAGLGWIGKNTLLLNRTAGSYFFLACLLTDLALECDAPFESDHCGTCRACLDACPTDAFVAPYVLDATRCISYLTIELRTQVPEELRPGLGPWVFGCDVCQDVCPWNNHAPESRAAEFQPRENQNPLALAELFFLDDAAFRARFRHTPLWRPKRRGILRNAAIVLGNAPDPQALPALVQGLADSEPLVRGACAWALARYEASSAHRALRERLAGEEEPEVRGEIERALARVGAET